MLRLAQDRLDAFLEAICRGLTVYGLTQDADQYHLSCGDTWDPGSNVLGAYRPIEPLKSLVFRPREAVGTGVGEIEERIVIGAKNCDISALRIHDHVFLKTEPVDPYYEEAREKTIIVSADCTDARDVCFCPIVEEQPYAESGFDINLSPTPEGILVEPGSERGEKLLAEAGLDLPEADDALIAARDAMRKTMTDKVTEQAGTKGLSCGADLQQAVQKTEESEFWGEFAQDCVECGGCNLICCTCHCFLLADGTGEDDSPDRVRQWDSCLYRNFARVAGGANPRDHRAERLYNRFDKKFNFFPEVMGIFACDGCGRCIEACTGKIDIREVLKKALDEA